jgi:hypothetical protein
MELLMFNPTDKFWWASKKDAAHQQLHEYIKRINNEQNFRATDNLRHMRLYGNQETLGFNLRQYSKVGSSSLENRVTLNVIQSMIDTVTSKTVKNMPLPMYLTDGGNWKQQNRAKKLNKFTEGQFYHSKVFQKGARAFVDACVFGTGVLKIFRNGNEVCVERVFPNEIIVDDSEAIYGEPRQMHQGKWIHREVLKANYPAYKRQIEEATQQILDQPYSDSRTPDMIYVLESWHLASKKGEKDGRHVITIDNCTLFDETYDKDYFPFVFMRWTPRLLGFFGQGLAEQLQGIQVEINRILRTVQISMHLVSVPRILKEHTSKIISEHFNNKIGSIIGYTGAPPQFMNANGAIPQELFLHLDRLYQRAFEIAGISQLSAQSKKPSGLDSGKALRTFNDIESERFYDVGKRYEDFYLEVAKHLLDTARDIDADPETKGGYKVTTPGKKFIETIRLKDCDLDDDMYITKVFPISALSKIPSMKLAEVQEMINTGMLAPDVGRRLLDFPDLEAENEIDNADENDIDWTIEQMVEHGEYLPPEPFQNLQLGIQRMQQTYLKLRTQNAPEDRLELLRIWIDDADAQMKEAQAAEAAALANSMPMGPPIQDPSLGGLEGVAIDPNAMPPASGIPAA